VVQIKAGQVVEEDLQERLDAQCKLPSGRAGLLPLGRRLSIARVRYAAMFTGSNNRASLFRTFPTRASTG
jgi:hypothetical protein